jgi:hypothetical protein
VTRAQAAEATLTTNLANEVTRAQTAETTIANNLSSEIARAQAAESTLTTNLTSEVTRAQAAEATLTTNLANEVTRAQTAETTIANNLSSEITRATAAETLLGNVKLNLSGGSMTGNLFMGQNRLSDLQPAAQPTDAVQYQQYQFALAALQADVDQKLSLTGGTVTGETFFNSGIVLDGGTSSFQSTTVDAFNRTNTYITFKPAGSSSDWAYLRQIGSSDNMQLALQFHDDSNDGRFSISRITSSANPDAAVVPLFQLSSTAATFSVPIIRNAWSSGELIQTKIYNASTNGTGEQEIEATGGIYNPPVTETWKTLSFTFKNPTLTTSVCTVEVDAPYWIEDYGGDFYSVEVYDITSTKQVIATKIQSFYNNSGGGTRSTTLLPIKASYTPAYATSTLTRTIKIDFTNNSIADSLFMCKLSAGGDVKDTWCVVMSEYKT